MPTLLENCIESIAELRLVTADDLDEVGLTAEQHARLIEAAAAADTASRPREPSYTPVNVPMIVPIYGEVRSADGVDDAAKKKGSKKDKEPKEKKKKDKKEGILDGASTAPLMLNAVAGSTSLT